jgi:hypothetical protein
MTLVWLSACAIRNSEGAISGAESIKSGYLRRDEIQTDPALAICGLAQAVRLRSAPLRAQAAMETEIDSFSTRDRIRGEYEERRNKNGAVKSE